MKDFISTNTGNSRYMKAALPADCTWEEALDMLRTGDFPFDLNGIGPGVQQVGTPLNKANLLTDATAALLALAQSDPNVNNALNKIGEKGLTFERGQYTGTGTSGSSNPTKITFTINPLFVWILYSNETANQLDFAGDIHYTAGSNVVLYDNTYNVASWSASNKRLSFYTTRSDTAANKAKYQANTSGQVYKWVAIGNFS